MLNEDVKMAVERSVRDIPESQLIWRVIANLRPTRRSPLWVRVMEAFGLGATYSAQLCQVHGFEPEATNRQAMVITARLQEQDRG